MSGHCRIYNRGMRLSVFAIAVLVAAVPVAADYREFTAIAKDPTLEARVHAAAAQSLRDLPALKREDLGITVVDVTNPSGPARADFNGDVSFYPASVIKLF